MGKLNIFKNKPVLVIGDTGFKGSWLSLWLHELGAQVFGYALPPEHERDHFNLLELNKIICHEHGDVRDFDHLKKYVETCQPEFVFHLAAQPLVLRSYQEPKLTFDTNIGGSINILEVIRQMESVRVLIYVTSDKVYKNKEQIKGYAEEDELGGYDPYSASKASAELIFSAYLSAFFKDRKDFGAASVRAGNVIGGGDWSDNRIMPDCIRALCANQSIIVRNPEAVRPWQHVLDPLYGYLLLATKLYKTPKAYSGAWNFGPHFEGAQSVRALVEHAIQVWGDGKLIVKNDKKKAPREATLLYLNCDKALKFLHWSPNWPFHEAVEKTVLWYKAITEGQSALETTKQQVCEYMEK